MQSAMDQTRNWVWESNKNYANRRIYVNSSPFDSLEEFAFAKDFAGDQWGCIWPPRFYSCNFCFREFRSAQALGGHMNVHRRDRARLKLEALSSSSNDEDNSNLNPNPNPNPNSVVAKVSFDLKLGGMDCCKRKREVDEGLSIHKRMKSSTTDNLDLGLSMKSDREYDQMQFLKSDEVLKLRTCQEEELDLELRLGDPPKVKQDGCIIMIE